MTKDQEKLSKSGDCDGNRSISPTSSRRNAHHDVDKDHHRSKHYRSKRSQSPSRSRSRERKHHKSYRRSSKHRSKRYRHGDRRYRSSSSPEQDRKRSKREKQHKHSSKTFHRKKKRKDDESTKHPSKPSLKRSDLVPIGPKVTEPPTQKLDPDQDYFSYHNHLRLFLYRRDGTYFEDLTSSETHHAFEEFCSLYNSGKLESAYYPNFELPQEALDQCKRTRHAWNFKTTQNEMNSLNLIKSGVKQQTEYDASISKKDISNPTATMDDANMMSQQGADDKDQLIRSMGLTPGQKIKIAPRR